MSTRRPSYSSSSSAGSFSAAQWSTSAYPSAYSSQNPYTSSYPPSHPPPPSMMTSPNGGLYAHDMGVPSSGGSGGGNVLLPHSYDYAVTPRSALSGGSARGAGGGPTDPYGDYTGASQPIPIARPSASPYTVTQQHQHQQHPHHHGSHPGYIATSSPPTAAGAMASYGPGTSPQSPSSPQSPTSPLSQYAYPASPQRPFACDMCALSFSRQHDLKRHRDTHSGEKPFFCNGGCGKQFTRKDALKRHQLVKRCGTDDC